MSDLFSGDALSVFLGTLLVRSGDALSVFLGTLLVRSGGSFNLLVGFGRILSAGGNGLAFVGGLSFVREEGATESSVFAGVVSGVESLLFLGGDSAVELFACVAAESALVLVAPLLIPLFLFLEDLLVLGLFLNNSFTMESGFDLPLVDGDGLLLRGENRVGDSFLFFCGRLLLLRRFFFFELPCSPPKVSFFGLLPSRPSSPLPPPPASPPPAGGVPDDGLVLEDRPPSLLFPLSGDDGEFWLPCLPSLVPPVSASASFSGVIKSTT